jgi:lipoate-protein ligase A
MTLLNTFNIERDVADQLQLEQDLIVKYKQHRQTSNSLWLWQAKPSLVVSKLDSNLTNFEKAKLFTESQGMPVDIRQSGGSAVIQNDQVINISRIYIQNDPISIEQSYLTMCQPVLNVLKALGIEAYLDSVEGSFCDGAYNIVYQGKKLAGTSQRWLSLPKSKAKVILEHMVIVLKHDYKSTTKILNDFYRIAGADQYFKDSVIISLEEINNKLTTKDFSERLLTEYALLS